MSLWVQVATRSLFLLALFVILLPAESAHANIRAPRIIKQYPAQELEGGVLGLEVQNEKLHIVCDGLCEVTARYEIIAKSEMTAELRFVAPVAGTLHVKTGTGEKLDASLEEIVGGQSVEPAIVPATLYRGRFAVHFVVGTNVVEMNYSHRPGAQETNYGYFSEGEMRPEFRYELWPLKEWQLSKTFTLELTIQSPSSASWLSRIFGAENKLFCYGVAEDKMSVGMETKRAGKLFEIRRAFDAHFPTSIFCSLP